jgi:hypothetical protein
MAYHRSGTTSFWRLKFNSHQPGGFAKVATACAFTYLAPCQDGQPSRGDWVSRFGDLVLSHLQPCVREFKQPRLLRVALFSARSAQ